MVARRARGRSVTGAQPRHRVLLTTDTVGGVWSYSVDLALAFADAGLAVELAILGPDVAVAALDERITLHRTGLALEWLGSAEEVRTARDALRGLAAEREAGIVHLHSPALVGGGRWQQPVVAVAHSCVGTWWHAIHPSEPLPEDLAWRAAMVAEGLREADAIVAPTAAFAASLNAVYGRTRPVTIIANGIAAQRRLPDHDGAIGIVTVGRLWDAAKNVQMLDAVAQRTGLCITAAGADISPFATRVALPHLRLAGSLDRRGVHRLLNRARIFASPARYEPFGLAALEAAQVGLALVLADIPTFRELWEGCAIFLPAEDIDAWSDTLSLLHDDTARCRELGLAARRRAADFTLPRQAAETSQLHRRCMSQLNLLGSAA